MDLLDSFIIAIGLNVLMFIPAFIFKTDKLTDISYGVSFALVALIIFYQNSFTPLKALLTSAKAWSKTSPLGPNVLANSRIFIVLSA